MKKLAKKKCNGTSKTPKRPEGNPPTQPVGTLGEVTNLKSALAFLDELQNLERMRASQVDVAKFFNLDRMRALMHALGDPQKRIPCIHVAGSKGKGSVCEMLASMLKAAGYGVGLYTSPHLRSILERIRVNNAMISDPEFVGRINEVRKASCLLDPALGEVTFFETLTAAAFRHFEELAVDFAVIETGMGGLLDATNIIEPKVSVITAIQREHLKLLGPGLGDVARHKAGIMKSGVPCYTMEQDPEVMRVFEEVAATIGSPLHVLGRDPLELSVRMEGDGARAIKSKICLTGSAGAYEHVAVPYLGEHQAANCALALCAIDCLRQRGFKISDGQIAAGLLNTPSNGRVQCVSKNPPVFIDGAHNPESVSAAIRSVASHVRAETLVVIFGCAGDKDVRGMLQSIAKCADKVFFTRVAGERAVDPGELLKMFREVKPVGPAHAYGSVDAALSMARSVIGQGDAILVTGSFAIAGEASRAFPPLQVVTEIKPSPRVHKH